MPIVDLPADRLETRFQDAKPLYTSTEAVVEANRCLFCYDAPCIDACPAGIDIPSFIGKIRSGNIEGAARTILKVNMAGVSTARVCPVEELCAGACVFNDLNSQPIQIGRLQRYATEKALRTEAETGRKLFSAAPSIDKRVALIGAGPASLACAAHLALEGVESVIYEQDNILGGLNTSGIAPYKLQALDALVEVDWMLNHGVKVHSGVAVGRDVKLEELRHQFDAVFLGIGLGKDGMLDIPGIDGPNVWGATDLIRKIKTDSHFSIPTEVQKVVVIGGGNTSIDIARELAMLGVPEVDILYRRTQSEMPGYKHELANARSKGVRIIEHVKPVEIKQNKDIELIAENSISGDPLSFHCDWLVVAIGQQKLAQHLIPELEVDDKGRVKVDPDTGMTSIKNLYAGGDCINGGKEVVNAVADGRDAAFAILRSWGIKANLDNRQEA
ncbi:FAD-dependent oxidoreductase [bacterium]|nr:FAD-dependent oxidoreductase [bacterium]